MSDAFFYIQKALYKNDLAVFIKQLRILFSDISYHLFPKQKKEPTVKDDLKNFIA